MNIRKLAIALALTLAPLPALAQDARPNEVVGTWRMVQATLDPGGEAILPYGPNPNSMLVFTPDMHFVEVLTNGDMPRFASDARGDGTDAENRAAMAQSIGFFGTYTVDENGVFSGNRVEGATFPNWVGSTRTTDELILTVRGDRMFETFTRPEGTRIEIEWERVN
ncbi:lipocalin-like domain-containing protein [Paroceanicella profunda]|uniref:Lipocalin-like domain-containing protein n=1 Tax=Paroceanicella profunda TaxID=2579971 RepID=A0A5B8FWI5_9RHOB|nr:lipocalin-like domain-containing protein [Paroceanicella profunda]QDL93226.1 lipocalin-like domain-containing protein [Paroceanicella profunda]